MPNLICPKVKSTGTKLSIDKINPKCQIAIIKIKTTKNMLKSISISNFKAIGETPLILDNLAKVNYLVGPNGCGKSSVLECLESIVKNYDYLEKRYITFIKDKSESNFVYGNTQEIGKIESLNYETSVNILQYVYQNKPTILLNMEKYSINYNLGKKEIFEKRYLEGFVIHKDFDKIEQELCEIDETYFNILKVEAAKIYKEILPIEDQLDFSQIYRNKKDNKNRLRIFNKNLSTTHIYENIASGKRQIFNLILYISYYLEEKIAKKIHIGYKIISFLLEEPETNLHPSFQKLLPKILNRCCILDKLNRIQFIISTHSPFIISAAAKEEDQKVYLIENGQTVDIYRKQTERAWLGYSGYEAKQVASEMLGVGWSDFHKEIVICEGDPKNREPGFDEMIYNTIFYNKNYLFISAGGETQLTTNSEMAKRVIKSIFSGGDSIAFYLKDGDSKSKNIKKDESEKSLTQFGYKTEFLEKRYIEIYLFDPSVVALAFDLEDDYQIEFDKKINQDDHCKNLKKWIREKTDKPNLSEKDLCLQLSQIIREMGKEELDSPVEERKNIYWQLHNCIFDK